MNESMKLLDTALVNASKSNPSNEVAVDEAAVTTANALSSVINYIITDAFDLQPEESLWVGYHLGEILSPLRNIKPNVLLAAVDRELQCGEYSKRMIKRFGDGSNVNAYIPAGAAEFSDGVKYAPVSDWVEGISEIILSSYPDLRPMIRSAIVGSIHGLFMELGVNDDPRTSRASLYLPNSVRYLLGSNEE